MERDFNNSPMETSIMATMFKESQMERENTSGRTGTITKAALKRVLVRGKESSRK